MRFFFDTEFAERPCTIDLISIGIVAEDGRTFYAESSETDWSQANMWVQMNVRPHLTGPLMTRAEIAAGILDFVGDDPDPQFWAYFGAYDWVVFCWLFGTMAKLPPHFPMFVRDLKQLALDVGNPRLPSQTSAAHNALADALWNVEVYAFLTNLTPDQRERP
jgi:hypothetical protein